MKKQTVQVTYEGISLKIVGGHSPAEPMSADRLTPPVKESFEIWEYIFRGQNLSVIFQAILSPEQENEIEKLCLEQLK